MGRYFFKEVNTGYFGAEFERIGVEEAGQNIMAKKAGILLIKAYGLSATAANILKQEFLSAGGDVAVHRGCISGEIKTSDALIMATEKTIRIVAKKLKMQPFGLKYLASDLLAFLENSGRLSFITLKRGVLDFNNSPLIMGIMNLTPDSCSLDGIDPKSERQITEKIESFIGDGVDIIDIGGESTKPNSLEVSAREEIERISNALKVAKRYNIPISVDTRHAKTADFALLMGADIINDVSGLKFDPKMAEVISAHKACVVLNHMRGTPENMEELAVYENFMDELTMEMRGVLEVAVKSGIAREKIILDPGFGFAKNKEQNIELLKRFNELKIFGQPLLAGVSRKRFLSLEKDDLLAKDVATLSANVLLAQSGANILRVHNVKMTRSVLEALKQF